MYTHKPAAAAECDCPPQWLIRKKWKNTGPNDNMYLYASVSVYTIDAHIIILKR